MDESSDLLRGLYTELGEKLVWNNFHIVTIFTLSAHNSVQASARCPMKITLLQTR